MFKIAFGLVRVAFKNPDFKIFADFKILAVQNPEFEVLPFQNPEFKIFADLMILAVQNTECKLLVF